MRVGLGRHSAPPCRALRLSAVFFATSKPSCASTSSVMLRASIGKAVVVQHAAQLRLPLRRQLELHQLQELRVAVLLDDVDALVRVDERHLSSGVNGYARSRKYEVSTFVSSRS